MHSKIEHELPKKIGEVFAGLHILLVSTILSQRASIFEELTVQGILIDRVCGAFHCLLSVEMKAGQQAPLKSQVMNYSGSFLSPSLLCAHIRSLASPGHSP